MNMKKLPLAAWIFIGLLVGIVGGLLLMTVPDKAGIAFAKAYIKPFGVIFLNLIKFIVVPLVLFSIIAGVIAMKDIKKVGTVGVKTLVYYLCTTAVAIVIALVLASFTQEWFPALSQLTAGGAFKAKEPVSFMQTLVDVFPSNIIQPLAKASMLQVIVISLFFGFGILLAGEKGALAGRVVESFNEVCMKVMDMIIRLSPVGVACLLMPVVAENGPELLGSLFAVVAVAYTGYILHAAVVYSTAISVFARVSPMRFFKEMVPAWIMAFSSASSVGTLPFTLKCAENMGARKEVSSFVVPLGATINMDGTAIYQGVCAVFIASCYGIDLTLGNMVTIVLTATLASIGTAGVPGAGVVMLAMVLESVGLPVEGIALVLGIDRLFDMGRTVINITGDAACAVIVSKMEDRKNA